MAFYHDLDVGLFVSGSNDEMLAGTDCLLVRGDVEVERR